VHVRNGVHRAHARLLAATSPPVGPSRSVASGDITPSPRRPSLERGAAPPGRQRLALARGGIPRCGSALLSLDRRALSVVRLEPDCELGLVPATPALQRQATLVADTASFLTANFGDLDASCTVPLTGSAWPRAETIPSTSLGRTPYFRWEPCPSR